MAITTNSVNRDKEYDFICDTVADVANLPVQPEAKTGSSAFIIGDGSGCSVYMLNSLGSWIEI